MNECLPLNDVPFGTRSEPINYRLLSSIEIRYASPFSSRMLKTRLLQSTKTFSSSFRERKDRETWNCAWKEEFSGAENTFVCEGNCSRQTFLDTSTAVSNVKKNLLSNWSLYTLFIDTPFKSETLINSSLTYYKLKFFNPRILKKDSSILVSNF